MYPKTPFPATKQEIFRFNYQGPQAHENQLLITDPNDETTVYYDPISPTTTLALEATLPANVLQNGKEYAARVKVRPKNGQWSEYSEPIKFWCFATPLFHFAVDGVRPTGDPPAIGLHNSSLTVNLVYRQSNGEGLKSFKVDLYGQDNKLLAAGQEKYNTGDLRYDTSDLTTTIRGLEDNAQYSIQAVAETDHGMIVKTERVYLNVDYVHPATFALIEVENLTESATIRLHSNLQMIEGYCTQDPPRFIDNERIDLTSYGARVIFDKGFSLTDDFTLHLVLQNIKDYVEVMRLQNGDNEIILDFMRGHRDFQMTEYAYFRLRVFNKYTNYELDSSYIPIPYFDDKIHVWVRRKNGIYDLDACICESGSHVITQPNEFDVQFKSSEHWSRVTTEGYRNVRDERLEF